MKKNKDTQICWIITEGMAGTENQCIGIANAVGLNYDVKRISLNQPWKSLSPYLGFETKSTFTPALSPPWPDILIASGRKSIAASRFIKKKSNGNSFTVQVQDPRISADHFDLVAVPAHDPLRGDNVIVTQASPNKITPALLDQAKQDFPEFSEFGAPRVAVLIGGSSSAYTMNETITRTLAEQLSALDASLMITCSRRTGEKNEKILRDTLDHGSNYFWDGNGNNPYLALLAWAGFILVTADSASMISESCTTGKPVYMIDLDGGAKRITQLHENLINDGKLRKFEGNLETFSYEPLNDAQRVASEIKRRLKDFTKNPE